MPRLSTTTLCVAALVVSAGAAAGKLVLLAQWPSSALLSTAVQSLIEASYLAMLLIGLRQAQGARTGRAGALAYWSFAVAILLFSMGAGIALHEGVARTAATAAAAGTSGALLVVGSAIIANGGIGLFSFRARSGSDDRAGGEGALLRALIAVSAGAVLGQLVALGGLLGSAGDPGLDSQASVAVGLAMAAVAAFAALEVRRALLGSGQIAEPLAETTAAAAPAGYVRAVHGALETKSIAGNSSKGSARGGGEPEEATSLPSAVTSEAPSLVVDKADPGANLAANQGANLGADAEARTPASPSGKPIVQVREGGRKGRGKRRR